MNLSRSALFVAASLTIGSGAMIATQQPRVNPADAHVAAAKAAAGGEHTALFERLCTVPPPQTPATAGQRAAARPAGPPPRTEWHADPAKVFDNLYFVGMTEYAAWALTTSDGIVIVDPLFDYSVEDEIVNGLTALKLDPKEIKYVIVSHGHIDHAGGAKLLQDRFGARVLASAEDWGLMERDKGTWPKPRRDMVVTDGQKLTVGDTTLTFYSTPGHTLGTISTLIPVKDNGKPHLAAAWGGTAFNWLQNRQGYITPERPDRFWFENYSKSAQRFRDIVAKEGADALIANHTAFDGSVKKLPAMAKRKAGDPNPYVIGAERVKRYLTVAEECAKAGIARLP